MTFTPKLTTTLTAISLGLAAPAIAQDDMQNARENAVEERESMEDSQVDTEEVRDDMQSARENAVEARDDMENSQGATRQNGEVAQIAPDDVTDGQVDAFVKAAIAVEEVRGIYLPQIQNAASQEERDALMAKANTEAMQAVEDVQGVTPSEYLAIARAAQNDQTLTDRINVELRSLRMR